MKVGQMFGSSIRAMAAGRLRALLSALGIVIGVASVIALVTVGQGAQQLITDQIASLGTNLITVTPGTSAGSGGRVSTEATEVFTLELARDLQERNPAVAAVAPVIQSSGLLIRPESGLNLRATVVGVDAAYAQVTNFQPLLGRFVREQDVEEASLVAVLGFEVAQQLFGLENPVGRSIQLSLGRQRFRLLVVGVMEPKGQLFFSNYDRQVYVPITALLYRGLQTRYVNSYIAAASSAGEVAEAVAQLEYFLQRRLGDPERFRVNNQQSLLQTLTQSVSTMTLLLAAIAGIALLVGGIGIMNIMLVSVAERTREIGIHKAIGARRRDIALLFLTEALVLSLSGGLGGLALGWAAGWVLTQAMQWPFSVSGQSIALALGFSVAVGLFFGVYPAMRAARLDPVEALRYE